MHTYLTKETFIQKGENYLFPIENRYEDDEVVMTIFGLLDEDCNIVDSEVVYY
tara:strand:+ start:229 stop:387 length:159 start_codon:yes stop_codon:yes gene_type:complete